MKLMMLPLFFALLWLAEPDVLQGEIPKTEPIVGHVAKAPGVNRAPGSVAIGSSRRTVADLLGDPAVRVGDEFWVYWDCRVSPERVNPEGFDALVVTFRGDAVVGLKVSDEARIQNALANLSCGVAEWVRINKCPLGPIY